MKKRDRVVAGVLTAALVILVLAGAYVVHLVRQTRNLDAARQAALTGYQAPVGVGRLRVYDAVGWSDCAVVQLYDPKGTFQTYVATLRTDGAWRVGAASSATMTIDFDVIGSREKCLGVARSGNGSTLS